MRYVILAALILAAGVLTVDSIRQRARRRARPNVRRMVAEALRAAPTDDPAVPLAAAIPVGATTAPEEGLGLVWDALVEELDPSGWRPKIAAGVEVREFPVRSGDDYALIATPDHLNHYQLEIWEARLTARMDGTRTIEELILDRLEEEGELDPPAVAGLVDMLRIQGLLEPQTVDVRALVKDRLDPASPGRRKLREFAKTLRIGWTGAERFTKFCYRHGLRFAYRPWGVVLSAVIAIGGFVALLATVASHRFVLELKAAPVETVILISLSFFLTACHELAHASAIVHYDRRVISSGFMIFFGSPAFFVDASDAQMLPKRGRIVQAFAGPWAELILAGGASLVLFAFPSMGIGHLLYRFAVINYFVIFENLVPLLRLDGYWILCDLIEEPDLRGKSIAFIQRDMWHRLRHREHLTWQDLGLATYGVVGTVYSIFSVWIGLYFWQRLFGGIVGDLWNGGLLSRLLLVALVFAFAGPVIRGLIDGIRALARRIKALISKVRFRFERDWRIEAAELIDALPGFDDLPEDVLSDLAGRVRLKTLPPGRAVFRQGDRPNAFYVVRKGALVVEDADPETGDTRVIRTLGRGDSFGELGLLDMAPRAATIRATSNTELFEVDKGTFDRLLADSIDAPRFAPTMQAFAEVRALPTFRTLSTERVAEVLEHGEWRTYVAGDVVIEQGEPGDAFYVISSGQATVDRDGEKVASLGPGSFFGELALLNDAPRAATVYATSALRTFRLDREGFDAVVAEQFRRTRPETARRRDRDMEH